MRAPEIRRIAIESIDRDLLGAAHALAAGIHADDLRTPRLDARVKAAGRGARLRFTVVADDGRVVAESDVPDPAFLDNHGNRPEIREAREKGVAALRARPPSR